MCSYVKAVDRAAWLNFPGAVSHPIFDAQHTPIQGASAMLNFFVSDTYPAPGVHEDNEGFYVISGEGKIMGGQEETPEHWVVTATLAESGDATCTCFLSKADGAVERIGT